MILWHDKETSTVAADLAVILRVTKDVNAVINTKMDKGRTLLHWAVIRENKSAINFLIQQPGIRKNVKDEKGLTPKDYALKLPKMRSKIIQLAIEPVAIKRITPHPTSADAHQ